MSTLDQDDARDWIALSVAAFARDWDFDCDSVYGDVRTEPADDEQRRVQTVISNRSPEL